MALPLISRGKIGLKYDDGDIKDRKLKFSLDTAVNPLLREILKLRVPTVKYKKGFSGRKLGMPTRQRMYSWIFYELIKLIVRDLMNGKLVYFQKNMKSVFYIAHVPVGEDVIRDGRPEQREGYETPDIDLKVTGYTRPVVILDMRYKTRVRPCKVQVPPALYSEIVDLVNAGKTFIKPEGVTLDRYSPDQIEANEKWRKRSNEIRFRL